MDWRAALSRIVNKPTTMDKLKASIARLTEYARDSRKRLLVVEDNPAELLGITELLGYDDIEVVTAENGRKALAMLREQPADCVVLDLKAAGHVRIRAAGDIFVRMTR